MRNWPEGTKLTFTENTADWEAVSQRDAQENLCHAAFPPPENLGIRPLYFTNEGWMTLPWMATGYGPTELEAEEAAWAKYQQIISCIHDIERIHHTGQPDAFLLDGDAACRKCGVYLPHFFMNDRIYGSRNLAHRGHEHQKRKYGNRPYIVHPLEVYTKTAFWKVTRPEEERIVMGAAAWLHDVKEDCQAPDSNPFVSDDEIREAGGDQAFQLVYWLTNPSKGIKKPRAYRKQMDREHIAIAPHPAKIIKLFDRICNLNDLRECNERDFLALYARESRLLWEVLKDADETLANQLLHVIERTERRANDAFVSGEKGYSQDIPHDES